MARAGGLALRDVPLKSTVAVDVDKARGSEVLNMKAGTERVSALIMSTTTDADVARPLVMGRLPLACLLLATRASTTAALSLL